ncbi:MAG TPA: hypothetical protein PL001_05835, partial [Candidatus Kryptobacter bacterium]|nr:hypothetical protein [Candidatus Kryptobacter bacterium]
MAYDPHKHHRRSVRLKNYDYSQPGAYFITICVEDRRCLFGEIIDAEMKVNPLGEIVEQSWNNIPNKYQNVEMDEFVVMPNHFHGIIIINENPNPNVGAMSHRPVSQPDDESVSIGATQGRPYKVTL